MSRKVVVDFRKNWLKAYIEQFKKADSKGRKEIKRNIYSNVHLSEVEKDNIWEEIVRWGYEYEDIS